MLHGISEFRKTLQETGNAILFPEEYSTNTLKKHSRMRECLPVSHLCRTRK